MRLATFRVDGVVRVGVVDGDHLQAVEAPDLLSVLAEWEQSGPPEPRGQVWSLAAVELLAPLPRPPRNVFCVGKNYQDHAREFSRSGYDRSAGGRSSRAPRWCSRSRPPPSWDRERRSSGTRR